MKASPVACKCVLAEVAPCFFVDKEVFELEMGDVEFTADCILENATTDPNRHTVGTHARLGFITANEFRHVGIGRVHGLEFTDEFALINFGAVARFGLPMFEDIPEFFSRNNEV